MSLLRRNGIIDNLALLYFDLMCMIGACLCVYLSLFSYTTPIIYFAEVDETETLPLQS